MQIIGKIVKYKHYIVRIGANFLLEEKHTRLFVKKRINEMLFEGYDDPLLDLVVKLNITAFKVPFKRFGWFAEVSHTFFCEKYGMLTTLIFLTEKQQHHL